MRFLWSLASTLSAAEYSCMCLIARLAQHAARPDLDCTRIRRCRKQENTSGSVGLRLECTPLDRESDRVEHVSLTQSSNHEWRHINTGVSATSSSDGVRRNSSRRDCSVHGTAHRGGSPSSPDLLLEVRSDPTGLQLIAVCQHIYLSRWEQYGKANKRSNELQTLATFWWLRSNKWTGQVLRTNAGSRLLFLEQTFWWRLLRTHRVLCGQM